MGLRRVRVTTVEVALSALLAAPLGAAVMFRVSPGEALHLSWAGLWSAVDMVGWVVIGQIVIAVGVVGLALQRSAARVAGCPRGDTPGWLEPAVESALIFGLLGTITGMMRGFIGIAPDELQPGPLVHGLGTALRSSAVGFAIAGVGLWLKRDPAPQGPPSGELSLETRAG
jgi:hypothetical protein